MWSATECRELSESYSYTGTSLYQISWNSATCGPIYLICASEIFGDSCASATAVSCRTPREIYESCRATTAKVNKKCFWDDCRHTSWRSVMILLTVVDSGERNESWLLFWVFAIVDEARQYSAFILAILSTWGRRDCSALAWQENSAIFRNGALRELVDHRLLLKSS